MDRYFANAIVNNMSKTTEYNQIELLNDISFMFEIDAEISKRYIQPRTFTTDFVIEVIDSDDVSKYYTMDVNLNLLSKYSKLFYTLLENKQAGDNSIPRLNVDDDHMCRIINFCETDCMNVQDLYHPDIVSVLDYLGFEPDFIKFTIKRIILWHGSVEYIIPDPYLISLCDFFCKNSKKYLTKKWLVDQLKNIEKIKDAVEIRLAYDLFE